MAKAKMPGVAEITQAQKAAFAFACEYLSTHALGIPADELDEKVFSQVLSNVTQALVKAYAQGWSDARGL